MRTGCLLLAIALFGCVGATTKDRPSPAGPSRVMVWGDAEDVVLVDPRGRISRENELDSDIEIPNFDRWDGGTETTLEDSTDAHDSHQNYVVVRFELSKPVVGRYRLFAKAKTAGDFEVIVTPDEYKDATARCKEIRRDIARGSGWYVWNIDFLADSTGAICPLRALEVMRASSTELRKLGLASNEKR